MQTPNKKVKSLYGHEWRGFSILLSWYWTLKFIRFLSFNLCLKGSWAYPAASHQPLLPPRCDWVSGCGEGEPGLPEAHLRGQGLLAAKGPSWRALLPQSEATQVHRWTHSHLHIHINWEPITCIIVVGRGCIFVTIFFCPPKCTIKKNTQKNPKNFCILVTVRHFFSVALLPLFILNVTHPSWFPFFEKLLWDIGRKAQYIY